MIKNNGPLDRQQGGVFPRAGRNRCGGFPEIPVREAKKAFKSIRLAALTKAITLELLEWGARWRFPVFMVGEQEVCICGPIVGNASEFWLSVVQE